MLPDLIYKIKVQFIELKRIRDERLFIFRMFSLVPGAGFVVSLVLKPVIFCVFIDCGAEL